jgi:hypothetical protein
VFKYRVEAVAQCHGSNAMKRQADKGRKYVYHVCLLDLISFFKRGHCDDSTHERRRCAWRTVNIVCCGRPFDRTLLTLAHTVGRTLKQRCCRRLQEHNSDLSHHCACAVSQAHIQFPGPHSVENRHQTHPTTSLTMYELAFVMNLPSATHARTHARAQDRQTWQVRRASGQLV